MTPSDHLLLLINSPNTVSSELAKDPTRPVSEVANRLYHLDEPSKVHKLLGKLHLSKPANPPSSPPAANVFGFSKDALDRVASAGRFKDRPSDLFLKIYHDVLLTLEQDPMAGLVSPPLLASTGVVPLSIISVIPDIIKHYADVIVRAETEIFFATNFWEASGAAKTICDAFIELSRRVGERGGPKIVVKMMYDRGNPKQVVEPHQLVDVETYIGPKVKLPHPDEIPNLSLEVMNYHKPPVGTFHAKYLVVDRKIVLLNSNNIQDRVNVEMMTQIEGDIVQGFYDMALLSWNNALTPPLSCIVSPPPPQTHFDFGLDHPHIFEEDLTPEANEVSKRTLHSQLGIETADKQKAQSQFDVDNWSEAERTEKGLGTEQKVSEHLNTGKKISSTEPSDPHAKPFRPHVVHSRHDPVPMALVNRRPHGQPGHGDTNNPQDAAWLAGFKYAQKTVFIQTPTFNATPVVAAALEAVRRGVEVTIFADLGFNDEGELLPYQGGTNEMVAIQMYRDLASDEEKSRLRIHWYTAKDQAKPITATQKSRNCHVKLAIFDGVVGMQGNGNQGAFDAQSWFHSQEINVLLDSPLICSEWWGAVLSNQNTFLHGRLDADGQWRDPKDGSTLEGAGHIPSGPFKSLAGVKGAIQRVRGEGGFET